MLLIFQRYSSRDLLGFGPSMELHDLSPDPIQQFQLWLHEAEVSGGLEFPNAMSLATVAADGKPSVRMVLLKSVNKDGFTFFTNYESRKAQNLATNPAAALCFFWEKLGLQVRVEGEVQKISRAESEAYFHTRPRGSQIGAWASPQSREIPSRATLEEKVKAIQLQFQHEEKIPLPDHWGGFCLAPVRIEFWKNGLNRLHDRFVYLREKKGWTIRRLAP